MKKIVFSFLFMISILLTKQVMADHNFAFCYPSTGYIYHTKNHYGNESATCSDGGEISFETFIQKKPSFKNHPDYLAYLKSIESEQKSIANDDSLERIYLCYDKNNYHGPTVNVRKGYKRSGKWYSNECQGKQKEITLEQFCTTYQETILNDRKKMLPLNSCSKFQEEKNNQIIVENKKAKEEEEKRKAKETEQKRIAEEKRKEKEKEEKRIADAKKKDEEKKQTQQDELYVIGSGTGFFVNDEGYVVTNEHVAGICKGLASYINGKTHLFRILALDERNDLALLRGEYRNRNYLNINVMGAEFGEDIMTFGFPLAENLSSSVKLTRGIVSSLSGPQNDISLIQIDAAIQPGNSGGPVLNYNGQVVGVASSGLNKIQMLLDEDSPYIPENVNFAVSANTLTSFLRSNSIKIYNKSYNKKSSQELAKIGMPPTIQLHCLNTIAAHKKLRESKNYNDVLLRKVVDLK